MPFLGPYSGQEGANPLISRAPNPGFECPITVLNPIHTPFYKDGSRL